ncbi:MAG: flagellar protein FlaG [Syntrophomonadaceae bacterium]|nr:flagellar protein FlaG [Syntrophomonadaceae bacterium]
MRVNGPGTATDCSFLRRELGRQALERPVVEGPVPGKEGARPGVTTGDAREKHAVNREQLEVAVELANKAMDISSYNLEFRIHKESGRVQVKVIDMETREVIREIPPEQMLELSASIKEMLEKFHEMVGVLVDKFV